MEHRDTEIVRDDINGTVREESHVTQGPAGAPLADSTAVVKSLNPARRPMELTYLVFGIIEGLLLIRLVLKLLAANPLAGFSKLIYGLTDVFMAPFRNLLPTVGSSSSGAVLETSVVIAVIVYALIGWVLARLIVIVFFRNVTVSQRSSRGIGGPRPY